MKLFLGVFKICISCLRVLCSRLVFGEVTSDFLFRVNTKSCIQFSKSHYSSLRKLMNKVLCRRLSSISTAPLLRREVGNDDTNSSSICAYCASRSHNLCIFPSNNIQRTLSVGGRGRNGPRLSIESRGWK